LRPATSRARSSRPRCWLSTSPRRRVAGALEGDEVLRARQQLLGREGLGQVVLHGAAQQPDAQRVVGLGRQDQDGDLAQVVVLADGGGEHVPAHPGHHQVADHEVGAHRAGLLQPLASVAGGGDAEAVREAFAQEAAQVRVVLDHEDAGAVVERPALGLVLLHLGGPAELLKDAAQALAAAQRGGASGGIAGRLADGGALGGAQRQVDLEQRAAPGGLGDGDLAAVEVHEVARDGEAEAGAPLLAGGGAVGLAEPFEDEGAGGRRDAGAAVAHRKDGAVAFGPQRHGDAAAGGRELEGVGQQVEHHPLDLGASISAGKVSGASMT
jgi:hypothetical protein